MVSKGPVPQSFLYFTGILTHTGPHTQKTPNGVWIRKRRENQKFYGSEMTSRPQILYYLNMFCFTCCFSLGLFDLGGGFVLCFLLSYSFVSTFPKYQTKSQIINFVLLFFHRPLREAVKLNFFWLLNLLLKEKICRINVGNDVIFPAVS